MPSAKTAWLVLLLLTAAARAYAAGDELKLEYTAPPACPSRDEIAAGIVHLAGAHESGATVHARVTVDAPTTRAWSANVSIRRDGLENTRTLTASTCKEVTDAA